MFQSNIRVEARTIAKTGALLFLMLAAIAACAVLLGGRLGIMVEKLAECPPEVVALLGIYDIKAKHISLMIFYMVVILLNIVAISKVAGAAVEAIKDDEENGSIRFFMNQTYSCNQVWIGKMIIAMVSAVVQWMVYILSMAFMVWLICYRCRINFDLELGNVLTIGTRGIVFVVLAVGICLLYSLTDEPSMTYDYFCSNVFYGMLFAGNLYKIFAMLSCYTASAKMELWLHKMENMFENLRILFPFTLLNVFNIGKNPLPDFAYMAYVLIAVVIIVVYGYMYRRDAA